MFLLISVCKLTNQLFQPQSNSRPTKRGGKLWFGQGFPPEKPIPLRVQAAQGRAVPGSRVPSVTGRGFPRLLSESLRVPPPPAGQRGRVRQLNPKKPSPFPCPPLPVRSQPEVEHGTGVHQQRPAGETGKWGRGRRGGWREGSEDGDGRQGHGERESGKGSEDGGGAPGW